jgi:hypothetical protein
MATTSTPSKPELRGSQKMLEHLAKNGAVPSLEEIKKALALPASTGVVVLNHLIRGLPPAYLELNATLQVPIAHLSDVVNRFVQLNDSTINMRILINGVPFPDLANIEIRNTPGEQ